MKLPARTNRQAPIATRPNVRMPAGCFARTARSAPIIAPRKIAKSNFSYIRSVGSAKYAGSCMAEVYRGVTVEQSPASAAEPFRFFHDYRYAFGLYAEVAQ